MVAQELLSYHIPSISCGDEGEKALGIMDENRVSHIAVVDGGEYHGLISDNDIYDLEDSFAPLNKVKPNLIRPFVYSHSHFYEIIAIVNEFNLSVIPVLDDQDQYVGVIALQELTKAFAQMTNASEPGGVLILGLNVRDYSMSQVAQIIESENAKILSSYIATEEESLKMDLVLKINKSDLSSIIASFDRYNYEIKASFHQSVHDEDLERRYQQFIKYINI